MNPSRAWQRSLQAASAIALSALLAACAYQPGAPQAASQGVTMTKARQEQMTPAQALEELREGNRRFVGGKMLQRNLPEQVKATGHDGQFPFASVVSCIDSRAAPSLVFDQGIGDLFTARVAGNIVNEDILGSLEYASKVAGSKLVVILGHTHCGAVKGACDSAVLGNLTQLVAKIRPAVDATPNTHGTDRSSNNHYFVDAVAENNVKMTVRTLLEKSPVLREMAEKGQIKVVGALLDVETGKVQFY
jgi:carbonic anhydrase